MHEDGKKLLNLMFKPDETICISHNKYSYHSIPLQNAINGPITLVPPDTSKEWEYPKSDELLLVALNPIKGYRQDANCTAYRNFLVEMDTGSLDAQLAYINKLKMPYSAVIFSGNKSLHFLISLSIDLPSEKIYRLFSNWILNIITLADQNIKNPSRSIRVAGAYREPGKQQILMPSPMKHVKLNDLVSWLSGHIDARPKERERRIVSDKPDLLQFKPWIAAMIGEGVMPPNRNKKWFTIAVEFALTGFDEDYTMEKLNKYFVPENDFKEKEWETIIRSAFKYVKERKQ